MVALRGIDSAARPVKQRPSEEEERLVRRALPLLRAQARRLWRRLGERVELEELMALAHPALVVLAREYDPSRGRFEPYAARRLHWAMLDGVRRQTHGRTAAARASACAASDRTAQAERAQPSVLGRAGDPLRSRRGLRAWLRQRAGALVVGLVASSGDMATAADPGDDPEQLTARLAACRALRSAVGQLPELERRIVERHYFGDERFDLIASDLGISKSWASRLHGRAIRSLALALRSSGSEPGSTPRPSGDR